MTDEQRVRTMCGWIGVEIGRSRVRTPGKAGYGLYRVRGERDTANGWVRSEWTAYALGLDAIKSAVEASIRNGSPSGPGSLITGAGVVPTRWTSAYRGSRTLGAMVDAGSLKREFAAEVEALVALIDAGLVVMRHEPDCGCRGTEALMSQCIRMTQGDYGLLEVFEVGCRDETEPNGDICPGTLRFTQGAVQAKCDACGGWAGRFAPTVRQRRREANAAFQAEHAPARAAGLEARHGAKLRRNAQSRD